MTEKQRVFDIVAKHLLTQGARALGANQRCAYRAYDGKKCAIGVLLSETFYNPSLEGEGVQALAVYEAVQLSGYRVPQVFLEQLQGIHDLTPPNLWCGYLADFAERHGLSRAILEVP